MDFRNQSELDTFFQKVLKDVMNELFIQIIEEINSYITSDVYERDYFPNKYYEFGNGKPGSGYPSFEFRKAFHWTREKNTGKEIQKTLFYDWENMTVNEDTGRHFEDGHDTRRELAGMLNVNGIVGGKQRMPYWDRFTEYLDLEFDRMFRRKMEERGIKLVHSGKFSSNYKSQVDALANTLNDYVMDNLGSFI